MNLKDIRIKSEALELHLGQGLSSDSIAVSAKNMLQTEGGYKSRPAIFTREDSVVYTPDEYAEYSEFQLTEFSLRIGGQTARLAIASETDERSYIYYHISAIFSNGSRRSLGYVPFRRNSSSSFSRPYRYVVYAGKETFGAGVYFLARLSGPDGDELRIYELGENYTDWTLISADSFYIPTLFINGRGDRAAFAILQNELKLSAVKRLEPLNRLCGSFDCRFTADGFSAGFTLPSFPTTPESITCRFKDEYDETFVWTLNSQNSFCAETLVNGTAVRAKLEVYSNKIKFTRADLSEYPLPYSGRENNLQISVRAAENPECAAATSVSAACNVSALSKSGSSLVTVFYGSLTSPDEVSWINPENPLYFPEGCSVRLNTPTDPDGKLFSLNGRIYLFCSNFVFSASVSAAESYNITDILNGTPTASVSLPSVSFDKQLTLPEEIVGKTVAHAGEEIFFCTNDGKINRLTPSLSHTCYSLRAAPLPETAAVGENGYLLIYGSSLRLFNPSDGSLTDWSLPVRVLSGCEVGGITLLLGRGAAEIIYCFTLSGSEDVYFSEDNSGNLISRPISSELTVTFKELRERSRLYTLWLDADFEGMATAELFDGKSKRGHHHFHSDNTLIQKPIFFDRLSAKLSFGGSAEIRKLALKYSRR